MLGRFEIVARRRPVDLVAPGFTQVSSDEPGSWALPQPAPYVAAETATASGRAQVALTSGDVVLEARLADGVLSLRVTAGGHTTHHRSRRFGRLDDPADRVAVSLTGTQLTGFTRERGRWVARSRYDLVERVDPRSEAFCAALGVTASGPATAGGFGQLGLRDVRLVTEADGTPLRDGGRLLLTATHAGPGFFDAAHLGVWSLDPDGWELEHRADLYFRRPGTPGVYGDHAAHLLREGDRWLVAVSTWGDFVRARRDATVTTTLAESTTDLTRGRHVLDTTYLPLPAESLRSVGTWDPHLLRDRSPTGDRWLVGFVSATRFFRFGPALAGGPTLDDLTLLGADQFRTATEGTTVLRLPDGSGGGLAVLASDGRKGPKDKRAQFPVFDLALRQTGRLEAPYPSNIAWPTLVELDHGWAMVAFDGTPTAGELLGYGSHGDLVILTTTPTARG